MSQLATGRNLSFLWRELHPMTPSAGRLDISIIGLLIASNEATPVTNGFMGRKRGRNAPRFPLGGQMASFPSIRIGITGSTESGKSTAVHNILLHALRFRWKSVILLDGKGRELCFYQHLPGVIYFGRDEISDWAAILQSITQEYSVRYAELTRRGLRCEWLPMMNRAIWW